MYIYTERKFDMEETHNKGIYKLYLKAYWDGSSWEIGILMDG
jgi:hypothetical protein